MNNLGKFKNDHGKVVGRFCQHFSQIKKIYIYKFEIILREVSENVGTFFSNFLETLKTF